ncbi:MAG: aspartate-semialdehyde dehydrogenase, partial [Clostridia bacterium]|nr:aspartate-semialdehyde dehydrogenase [Clostridia bacterium]
TKEEQKMIFETKKILGDESLKITATTVRVPVFHGHSESINVEFNSPVTLEGVKQTLADAEGIVLMDDPANGVYPTALEAENHDEVFVGRVRLDESVDSGINMWVVADNIRKGAATNAVQIAERIIAKLSK